ncbi:hypothetical protein MMC07_000967 [Pseudocyphellaria aurata]|nr:hypothetical protein [Pseudocyphellaria aurata]
MSPQTSKPEQPLSPDGSIIDVRSDEQKNDSDLRVLWSKVMDQGPYRNPSTYSEVEALFICWAENSDDLATSEEVNRLRSVLENRFNYHVQVQLLDNQTDNRLQVRINRIVADFVDDRGGPNTLLIVYYAGHGRPGSYYGSLELFGASSPKDSKKRMDSLVWNKTEDILRQTDNDVLEIFDCCYAGNLGLSRGQPRLFEYLAAAKPLATTPIPGDKSFTSALIYALEALVEDNEGGRFTTDELLRKIQRAPNFSKEQKPVLSDREGNMSTGRIMLHPLDRNRTITQSPSKESPSLDPTTRHILTLHFDFGERPSNSSIEKLGLQLNKNFDLNTLGVHRVRLGHLRSSMFDRAAKSFTASLRNRRMSGRQKRTAMDTLVSVPCSAHQGSLGGQISTAPRDEGTNTLESTLVVAPVSPLSIADSEDHNSDHGKKRKLRS